MSRVWHRLYIGFVLWKWHLLIFLLLFFHFSRVECLTLVVIEIWGWTVHCTGCPSRCRSRGSIPDLCPVGVRSYFFNNCRGSSSRAQQVKGLAWSLLWLGSLWWRRFDSWPKSCCMPWAQPKINKSINNCQVPFGDKIAPRWEPLL